MSRKNSKSAQNSPVVAKSASVAQEKKPMKRTSKKSTVAPVAETMFVVRRTSQKDGKVKVSYSSAGVLDHCRSVAKASLATYGKPWILSVVGDMYHAIRSNAAGDIVTQITFEVVELDASMKVRDGLTTEAARANESGKKVVLEDMIAAQGAPKADAAPAAEKPAAKKSAKKAAPVAEESAPVVADSPEVAQLKAMIAQMQAQIAALTTPAAPVVAEKPAAKKSPAKRAKKAAAAPVVAEKPAAKKSPAKRTKNAAAAPVVADNYTLRIVQKNGDISDTMLGTREDRTRAMQLLATKWAENGAKAQTQKNGDIVITTPSGDVKVLSVVQM